MHGDMAGLLLAALLCKSTKIWGNLYPYPFAAQICGAFLEDSTWVVVLPTDWGSQVIFRPLGQRSW